MARRVASATGRAETPSHEIPFACRNVVSGSRSEYICEYIMATSVHIPAALLEAVDRRAKALKVSRNRLIVRALQREVSEPSGWSPEFLERLQRVGMGTAEAVD